ncbi:unnamed protein product [Adineta ricciae]|uniref:Uncharacterized protein n=1 Tax=Adineta ricciae TaxID=249248 RepID=A0A814X1Q0_ADIRI|nr:unnamed protein product [Adineta ricciae]CAF1308240.1 unnamed protein product [Adineta ricciae]
MYSYSTIVMITIAVMLSLGFLTLFIIQLVMGAMHFNKCPVQPMFPWLNLVSGSTGMLLFLAVPMIFLFCKLKWKKLITCLIILVTILALFFLVWTIYSNYARFSASNSMNIMQYENATLSTYCHPQLAEVTRGTFITLDVILGLSTCLVSGGAAAS